MKIYSLSFKLNWELKTQFWTEIENFIWETLHASDSGNIIQNNAGN